MKHRQYNIHCIAYENLELRLYQGTIGYTMVYIQNKSQRIHPHPIKTQTINPKEQGNQNQPSATFCNYLHFHVAYVST